MREAFQGNRIAIVNGAGDSLSKSRDTRHKVISRLRVRIYGAPSAGSNGRWGSNEWPPCWAGRQFAAILAD
jgi:hypothetical protein